MDDLKFKQFINECCNKHKTEFTENFTEDFNKSCDEFDDKARSDILSSQIGVAIGLAISAANKFTHAVLCDYHNWLIENYEIKPKKQ